MDELTITERYDLLGYENVIRKGLKTFIDVGNALMAIRDGRLYRVEYATFEEYCKQKWDMSRNYADRLIGAADVAEDLMPIGVKLPTSESVLRPLTNLEPEARREVFQRAATTAPNGRVTAAHVESTKREYQAAVPTIADPVPALSHPEPAPNGKHKMSVHFSSESPEHYTPTLVIAAAVDCMGAIDLDPCSNSKDSPNVPALDHYTAADNGLSMPWFGRVYMNPPYGREIGDWVSKLRREYENGNTTEAIALVPARTDTQWFRSLDCFACCYVAGRLTFIGNDDPAPFPSAIFYLGEDMQKFYHAFRHMGTIKIELDEGWFTE